MAAVLFSIVGYFQVERILNWLALPVGEFVFTAPTEAFFIHLKIAFGVGCVLAFPVWVFELWQFIGKALAVRERGIVLKLLPFALALFSLGSAMAIFIVTPKAIQFLMGFGSPTLRPMISLSSYLSFVFWLIIGFGVFFQLPIVVVALVRTGVVAASTFAAYRRHVIVGIFLMAAFLTPGPDIFSQLLLAIPSYLLFEVSLVIAGRSKKA